MPIVDRGDARIFWEEAGAGEPVLLIMGLGYPSDMWHRQWHALSDRFRAIRFDNRGVGQTGVPLGPYTVEVMAADAVAVLDAAGVDRAHIVGASMGGLIAQELVLTQPDRARSLVLACTGPGGAAMAPGDPAALEMMAARATMPPDEAAEVAVPFVYAKTTPRARIEEDFAIRLANPTSPEGYANQLLGVGQWSGAFDRLGQIDLPTLVLAGRDDGLVNPENSKILANAIRGSRLTLLDDASHIFFTDQPEATNDALIGFLAEQA